MGCCNATQNTKKEKELCFQSNESSLSINVETENQDLKIDPAFLQNEDFKDNQKKLNPVIKSDINQGFSDKKPEIFNEKPEIPNISNEISKQKPGIYKEKPEFYEEKFETVKKSNGINQETVKKNAYYEGKTNFESAFSEEMNKMKKSLEILNKESEDLKEEFKNKGFTKEKIEISTLKDEFFKEKTEFLDYLKTIKGKKPGIESFEGKSLSFEIKMRENQKENDNFIENLMVVMPKQAKLLINIENRLFIMEIKGQDIENEYLSAVLCDLMGN